MEAELIDVYKLYWQETGDTSSQSVLGVCDSVPSALLAVD